ncbi:transcription factor LG2 isoform X1 [Lolium perenne]|uniref:transcription factor LG2 isoform X1 n=1 Tax=Lolium perenne TaxID=4522 RepID=UPI0021F65F6B|nr:transcription factor LG2-like isoform X1 [Lolium perenne]XP_051226555.1 transcription factor LG2-like isoform X1 [Lolium perenne]XP_051226556.1 transcription factor LG2-like isoform X1 [Lolium perenne]XP_051226557.1 transcription factor LG2-like isoform X1 [Lolium perenne]
MVQGEEESSWRMMASVHDHDIQHLNQATLAYHGGLHQAHHHHHHASAAPPTSSFLDFQPTAAAAAYFGELEEALINGGATAGGIGVDHRHPGGMITSDVQTKSAAGYLAGTGRPPTLEIFPSWPMRHQPQQLHSGNSQSVGSTTDSSSARNTMAQMVSPASSVRPSPPSSDEQRHEVMMVTTDDYSYKPGALAAAGPPPPPAVAAATASFQQQMQLHGGGDHDKRKHGSTRKDGKLVDSKTERRLAQNREAAKKSRLRKKAYVQNLETSRVRLQQMEQELQRARSQGMFLGGCSAAGDMSPGAAMFDMEYARWLDDDGKRLTELRSGLQAHLQDSNLGLIVDECMHHYDELFQLKAELARSDVFHLLTGAWTTPAERCFFWMGGFRPSELLKILSQQLDPLTEQQMVSIYSLQQSSEQTEEALGQGLQQLHQSLADTVAAGTLNDGTAAPNYMGLMAIALEKLASLESFYQQADNLRQVTLHQMRRILTTRQAARCFLSIGEYYRRLRALSSLWASRPRENFIGAESLSPTGPELQGMHHQLQQNQFSGF